MYLDNHSAIEFAIVMMLLTESFPLGAQGICVTIVEGLSQIGCFMAPLLINMCINEQIHPILLLSIMIFFLDFLPLFGLPEARAQTDENNDTKGI